MQSDTQAVNPWRVTETERKAVYSPHDEAQLVPLSLTLVVLQVVHSPSALLLGQLLDKGLPLLALLQGCLLDGRDALRVRSDRVDDKLVLLAELELVVGLEAGLVLQSCCFDINSLLQPLTDLNQETTYRLDSGRLSVPSIRSKQKHAWADEFRLGTSSETRLPTIF